MPVFFVLLVGLVIYGAIEGDIGDAAAFLFTPDWSKLTPEVMNSALGQALFSLSLGVAGLITYGSYIKEGSALGPTAAIIAIADTCVALLAGLMIFPIVFAVGLDPAAGPTLVFQTLPFAFQTMPGGALFGLLFFLLILVAAVTKLDFAARSADRLRIGERGWSRPKSALIFGGGAFLIGIACLLGYNVWSDVRPLGFWDLFADTDILDTVDGFTGKVMLPVGALLTSIFIGWKADTNLLRTTHRPVAPWRSESGVSCWRGCARWPWRSSWSPGCSPPFSRLSAAPPAAEPGPRHCAERMG
jgi:NSS family neurotransmitter:Na+ symporter